MAKSRSNSVDAIDMLKQDHEKVEKAFKEFERPGDKDAAACRDLIVRVCQELKVHTTLEEEIFYPAVREAIDDEEIMNEAAVEHETAGMLIEQLENMEEDDPNYHATFKVLGEYVRHHIRQEESRMFPAAEEAVIDLDALGARLRERKEELAGDSRESARLTRRLEPPSVRPPGR